jgi:hypothetical protein
MATVIGDAFIRIRPLTTGFATETAASVDAEAGGAGLLAGSTLEADAKKKGAQIGEATSRGAEEEAGAEGGIVARLFGGSAAADAAEAGEVAGASFIGAAGSKITGGLGKISSILSLGTSTNPWIAIGAAAVVASAGVAYAAFDMANKFHTAVVQIANNANISVRAAEMIGKAFEGTAFKVEFNATDIANAYATVAGQMGLTVGHALDNEEAMTFMSAAMKLATASGQGLGVSTNALSQFMATFKISLDDVNDAADTLYNTSSLTRVGQTQLATQFEHTRSRVGDLMGSYKEYAGLLVDAAKQGFAGRTALMEQTSAVQTLLGPQNKIVQAKMDEANALKGLTPLQQELAKQYALGAYSSGVLAEQTAGMTVAQRAQIAAYKTANQALLSAQQSQKELGVQTLDSKGKFVGWASVIDQARQKMEHMDQIQQQTYADMLFGKGAAAQMTAVVLAGSGAYQKYYDMANKAGTVNRGAANQMDTLHGAFDRLRAGIHDAMIDLGEKLTPAFDKVKEAVTKLINLIIRDWPNIEFGFQTMWTLVGPILKSWWDAIKLIWDVLMDLIGFVTDVLTGKWANAWGEIQHIFESFKAFVQNVVTNLIHLLGTLVTAFFTAGVQAGEKIMSGIGGLPTKFKNLLAQLPGDVVNAFTNINWDNVWDEALDSFKLFAAHFIQMWDSSIGHLPGMHINDPWSGLLTPAYLKRAETNLKDNPGNKTAFMDMVRAVARDGGLKIPNAGDIHLHSDINVHVSQSGVSGAELIAKQVRAEIERHDDILLTKIKAFTSGRRS